MKSFCSAIALFLVATLCDTSVASAHKGRQISHVRRYGLGHGMPLLARGNHNDTNRRRSCKRKQTISSATASGTATSALVSAQPSTTSTPPQSGGQPGVNPPPYWPSKTQAAATYSATAASPSDPMLLSVSEALNNKGNALYTQVHNGDLTYYAQGLGACGDTYDDNSYTAAVSHLLYDTWPGANGQQNRNAICGPYTPGRSIINNAGTFDKAVKSPAGSIMIGGDGLPNCDPAPGSQCHIPLTATITNPATGKSAIVKIVDRCTGCAIGDIDVTPTVFADIADMTLGRVHGIHWQFNMY